MDKSILTQIENGVMLITLNRPDRLNAFHLEMIHEWADALRTAKQDPDVKVVVLTGAGRAFCSGGDMELMNGVEQTPLSRKLDLSEHIHQVARASEDLDKPYICALNGLATGAGLDMALMCDIRIAARSARFSEGYVRVGLVPGDGGAYYLPKLVGISRALELLWTGDWILAEEAERIGLVNHVVDDQNLMTAAMELAMRLAKGPSLAIRMIKRAVYQSQNMDLRSALDLISSHLGIIAFTDDHKEGVSALSEKRTPIFTGH